MFTFSTKEQAKAMMNLMMKCMPKIHHTIIPISGPKVRYAVIAGKGMYNG